MIIGVLFSLLASVLFASLCYYSVFLPPLDGFAVAGWRMLGTLVILTLSLVCLKQGRVFIRQLKQILDHRTQLIILVACSLLMMVQVWLFGWAPMNHQGQALAMGYFLMPLSMVITGRFVFGENLSRLQIIALALACIGVAAELTLNGGLSWVSLLVMLGYPPYFVLKRKLGLNALHGMLAEHLFMMPIALGVLSQKNWNWSYYDTLGWHAWITIAGLGLLGSFALLSFLAASHRLPMSLFGMLGYVEPVLLFWVALMLGESFSDGDWLTFIPIWLAVLCLALNGWLAFRQRRSTLPTQKPISV